MPSRPLEELPKTLARWTGEDSELDDVVFEAVKAATVVNRNYTNSLGNTINLHMPMFVEETSPFTPHNPRHCYKGAGFEILSDDVIDLPIDDATTIKARFMTLERGTEKAQLLYWYQLRNAIVVDDGGMRRARWNERGQEKRSPIVKVLLQASAQNEYEAEIQLRSIAVPIYDWLRSVMPPDSDAAETSPVAAPASSPEPPFEPAQNDGSDEAAS
jgi:EpsI family protein